MKQEINIDDLIRSTVKTEGIQSPDASFTERVMADVADIQIKHSLYKPLISRKGFIAILCFIALIIAMIFFVPTAQSSILFNTSFFDNILTYFKTHQFKIEIPGSIAYILTSALLMLFLQAIVISKFFRKAH